MTSLSKKSFYHEVYDALRFSSRYLSSDFRECDMFTLYTHTNTSSWALCSRENAFVMKLLLFLHRLLTLSMNSTALSSHLVTRPLDGERSVCQAWIIGPLPNLLGFVVVVVGLYVCCLSLKMHDLLWHNKYKRIGYAGKAMFIHACTFVLCYPATPFMQSSNNTAQIC